MFVWTGRAEGPKMYDTISDLHKMVSSRYES